MNEQINQEHRVTFSEDLEVIWDIPLYDDIGLIMGRVHFYVIQCTCQNNTWARRYYEIDIIDIYDDKLKAFVKVPKNKTVEIEIKAFDDCLRQYQYSRRTKAEYDPVKGMPKTVSIL